MAQAAALLAGSGVLRFDGRYAALQKQRLSVVGEGWAGLVGRMAAAGRSRCPHRGQLSSERRRTGRVVRGRADV